MSESMIERVARAMAEKPSGSRDSAIWLNLSEHSKDYFLQLALAAIEAMREPTVGMLAAAFPIGANEEFSHEDKCLGAATCLKLGGSASIGVLEGEAVKQAAFLARDYRLMIDAALSEKS